MAEKKQKVLLVEDDPGHAELIQELLGEVKDAPFDLLWVNHLAAGLRRLDEGGIDVALLDLSLPDSDGFETFARVHAHSPEMPILVYTALNDGELAVRAVREGAQDYLIKGQLSGSNLVRSLRYAIERKRAERERIRMAEQLRTAADVSEQISAILDFDQLLNKVVTLLQSRFDLYYVHIYLLDPETQNLVMYMGSGEVGRALREQGHSIPLATEKSLVARAARERKVVAVAEICAEPAFMPNPLLPDTCSEVAVPLIAAGRVLGVLDLQDNRAHRFTQTDIDTFTTLAGQIATALQNARLFDRLQATSEQLRGLDHLKSDFLTDMSHDLRTSLNSIVGYINILLMGIDGQLSSEVMEDVQAIYEHSQRMLRPIDKINDVLDWAKLEAGRLTLNFEEIGLPSLLEDLRANYAHVVAGRPIKMTVEVEKGLPLVEADRVRLNQVLNNLIGRAVESTEEGEIRVWAFGDEGWVCVEVTDTGLGLGEADLQVILEGSSQVAAAFARRAEGRTLGLMLARHLVQMHGGKFEVRSQLGRGSTFVIRLPAQRVCR